MRTEAVNSEALRLKLCKGYPVEYEYSTHPFCSFAISESVGYAVETGISDDMKCWIGYDWCGNPVGIADREYISVPSIAPEDGERIAIKRVADEWVYLVGTLDEIYKWRAAPGKEDTGEQDPGNP